MSFANKFEHTHTRGGKHLLFACNKLSARESFVITIHKIVTRAEELMAPVSITSVSIKWVKRVAFAASSRAKWWKKRTSLTRASTQQSHSPSPRFQRYVRCWTTTLCTEISFSHVSIPVERCKLLLQFYLCWGRRVKGDWGRERGKKEFQTNAVFCDLFLK